MVKYTREERWDRACLRVAIVIRGMWEEKGSSDSRLLESMMLPDDLTMVGKSVALTGRGRREHVVPRLVIVNECHRMLACGATDAEVAAYIKDHVRIVLVTDEERLRLDRVDQMGLRQTMPPGWMPGHDIFARLAAADIVWTPQAAHAGAAV